MAEDKLTALEDLLKARDAVIEPGILSLLQKYVANGGKPSTAVEMLSDNYVGYAPMSRLVCSWLEVAEDGPTEDRTNGARAEALEAGFAASLVREKFSARAADALLSKGPAAASWLSELINTPEGRQLCVELAGAHKRSLLLTYILHQIWASGHRAELASAPGAACPYLAVYHNMLESRLTKFLALSEASLDRHGPGAGTPNAPPAAEGAAAGGRGGPTGGGAPGPNLAGSGAHHGERAHKAAIERAGLVRETHDAGKEVIALALSGDEPTCHYTLLVLQAIEEKAGGCAALAGLRRELEAAMARESRARLSF